MNTNVKHAKKSGKRKMTSTIAMIVVGEFAILVVIVFGLLVARNAAKN